MIGNLKVSREAVQKDQEATAVAVEKAAELMPKPEVKRVIGEIAGIPAVGLHLVPRSLLDILEVQAQMMKDIYPELDILSIVFHPGKARDEEDNQLVVGCYTPATQSIAIYVGSAVAIAKESMSNPEVNTSFLVNMWLSVILAVAHETAHYLGNLGENNNWTEAQKEAFCDDVANESLERLAKSVNIEPVLDAAAWGPVISQDINFAIDGAREIDDVNVQKAIVMFDNKIIYNDEDGQVIKSLRKLLRLVANQGSNEDTDPDWFKPVDKAPAMKVYDRSAALGGFYPNPNAPEKIVGDVFGGSPMVGIEPNAIGSDTLLQSSDSDLDNSSLDLPFNPYGSEGLDYTEDGGFSSGSGGNTAFHPAPPAQEAPVHAIQGEAFQACIKAVLMRLYIHMFSKCQFTGKAYGNAGAVLEPVSIADIPHALEIFVAIDTVTAAGQFIKKTAINRPTDGETRPAGTVKGMTSKNGAIPMYHLYINKGDGVLTRCSLLAQNPLKTKGDGNLSAWAARAQLGHAIAMLMVESPTGNVCSTRIETAPGRPVAEAYYGPAFNN